jgi:membrane protease YdiL (CAAX protease family)
VFYFLVPVIVVKFVLRENLSGYGLVRKGAFADYPLYGVLLAIMIPLVICASFTEGFQEKYPFYHFRQGEPLWPNLWTWEALYFLQFFALEFFFRGFLLHGIKHRFGFYSVFVMTILYCMIHFGKPLPETIAAIFAGIILGALSLKSRSILLGVAIHYSVAILMDLAALWQKGFLWNE